MFKPSTKSVKLYLYNEFTMLGLTDYCNLFSSTTWDGCHPFFVDTGSGYVITLDNCNTGKVFLINTI